MVLEHFYADHGSLRLRITVAEDTAHSSQTYLKCNVTLYLKYAVTCKIYTFV